VADLAVIKPSVAAAVGLTFLAASAGGETYSNEGVTLFFVNNGSGAPVNVTVASPGLEAPSGPGVVFNAGCVYPCAAGQITVLGPFSDKARFDDPSGKVSVTYSAVTSVTVRPVRAA
jgi:hypothetical protein